MISTKGYAAQSATSPLAPFSFQRRDPGPTDVQIEITHCGVCHSDLHQARNDWRGSTFPIVPGHEIIGRVVRTGAQIRKLKVGDTAGIGCMVYSCRTRPSCREGLEQYCDHGPTWTYNSQDERFGGMTYGGYSETIVVDVALFTTSAGKKADALPVSVFSLTGKRRAVAGSTIGGIAETQEMLDYCAAHGIPCDIETIRIQQVNEAYERLLRNDVKYRFVIDMASLKE